MHIRKVLVLVTATAALAALGAGGAWTYDTWRGWLFPAHSAAEAEAEEEHAHEPEGRIRLSPQARANLRLVVQPIRLETYWRTLQVPGLVVERHGQGDRGVTAPVTGVVTRIAAVPGDAVRPGDELFTLRLVSDYVQNSQAQLYKTVRELEINRDEQRRLRGSPDSEALFRSRLIELGYEERRLTAALDTYRQDLFARGLTPHHLAEVIRGNFVTEIKVTVPGDGAAPPVAAGGVQPAALVPTLSAETDAAAPVYDVEELKVKLGEQAQAGQTLCQLADHRQLYLEGRAFEEEVGLLQQAAHHDRDVTAVFQAASEDGQPLVREGLRIRFIANKFDPGSRTLAFYVALPNELCHPARPGQKDHPHWRFRPGQRARLGVPVQPYADVFVLPAAAVVRDGPEVYVFRANGDVFDRKPVQVLFEDGRHVVLANDGSITAGTAIAHNGAGPLQRALKAQAAGDDHGHGDHHHDH